MPCRFAPTLLQGKCNKCEFPDSVKCPAISKIAYTSTLIHWTPVPRVEITSPTLIEIRAGSDLSLLSDIYVPDDRKCCEKSGCSNRPFGSDVAKLLTPIRLQFSTFKAADTDKLTTVKWSMDELVFLNRQYGTEEYLFHASTRLEDYSKNIIDLEYNGLETRAGLIQVPAHLLQAGHYYKFTVHVQMANLGQSVNMYQNGSDAVIVHVKNRVLVPEILIAEDRATGLKYVPLDNSFITLLGQGIGSPTFPVRISAKDTPGLSEIPDSAIVTYLWDCRKWPAGDLEYWRMDTDIVQPDDRVVERCFFNNSVLGKPYPQTQVEKDDSFPCCNRDEISALSVELDDRYTYEFNVTIYVEYATDYEGKVRDEFRGFRRVTVRRQDSASNDFFLYGRTIEVQLSTSNNINPEKIVPDEDLVLYANVPRDSLTRALQSWNGKCEHPLRKGQAACRLEFEEIAQGLDVRDPIVSESTTLINVNSYPEFMSFKMKPEIMVPGSRFVFRLTIKTIELSLQGDTWRERGYAELMLEVNRSPRSGALVTTPSAGMAYITEFDLEAYRFEDDTEDLPLKYAFYFTIADGDRIYVSDSSHNTKCTAKFPMLEEHAAFSPCEADYALPGGPCAIFKAHTLITDAFGAQTIASREIMVTFDPAESMTYDVIIDYFDEMRRQAFLSKNLGYAAMCSSLRAISSMLKHPALAPSILRKNTQDPLSVQLPVFKRGILDTLIDVSLHEDGAYVQSTPLMGAMILQAIEDALSQQDQVTNEQLDQLYALVNKLTKGTETYKVDRNLLSSMLSQAAKLVRRSLSRFSIPGIARRRLLQAPSQAQQTAAVQSSLAFLSQTIRSVCTSSLIGASMDASGRVDYETPLFSTTCSKFAKISLPNTRTVGTAVPETEACKAVHISMEGWSSDQDTDLAITVFKFNPVSFPVVKTGDNLIDGQIQHAYGVEWPLHPNSCPVLLEHILQGSVIPQPYRVLNIATSVPLSVARQTFSESRDSFVFKDTIFSATCQQWYSSSVAQPGAWFAKNATADIMESSPNFICNTSHWPVTSFAVPPPLASGEIMCKYVAIPNPPSYAPSALYGIITEPTDCTGVIDVQARKPAGVDWPSGQFAFVSTPPSKRNVCDRCKVCGGAVDCVLTCSSKSDSDEMLDLCGVCGGICTFDAGCFPEACTNPYFRYLGNLFPNDWDVRPDGLTTGLLKKDGPCPQIVGPDGFIDRPPARSPNGLCSSLDPEKLDARIERYPYNNLEKTCWENSPMVPSDSPDKVCEFAPGSFFLDDPVGGSRTLTIEALDHNGLSKVGEVEVADRILRFDPDGFATFAGNSTRTIEETGTRAAILTAINRLRYQPPPHWSSHYPPIMRRQLRFSLATGGLPSQIPATVVHLRIRPVNDPPRITASVTPYRIQEDRVTRVAKPPVTIVDDAAEVTGHYLNVTLRVWRTGARIRTASSGNFDNFIAISGSLAYVNGDLASLDYLGPENSNDNFDPKDSIFVTVNDNGYGGEHPYNTSMSNALLVNLTLVIQNDPPIALIEKRSVIFEGKNVRIKGAHVVDPDGFQHANRLYDGSLSTEQGSLSLGILKPNCTVLARMPYKFVKPSAWRYVDETLPLLDPIVAYKVGFLKLDGRPERHKAVYLNFELNREAIQDATAYSGVRIVLALFKHDCYDAMSDGGVAGAAGLAAQWQPGCIRSGSFPVSLVQCRIAGPDDPFFWKSHTGLEGEKIGVAHFAARRSEWVYADLDAAFVLEKLAGSTKLCLRLEDVPAVNETLRFLAPVTTSAAQRSSTEENLLPRIEIHMGTATNVSFFPQQSADATAPETCFLEVKMGSGIEDKNFKAQAKLEVLNKLVEDIEYSIAGKFSNRLGGDAVNVTFSVEDVSARAACVAAQADFGFQACDQHNQANASVFVIPIKEDRTPLRMQPWYADRWVRVRSTRGDLPVIVQLEDCGNRGWEEDCPYRLQVVPDDVSGEYASGRISVEIASRLGTLTVPEKLRSPLTFEKGSGFRDAVMRFTGFAPDVRKAMMDLIYHSRLDQHTQYKNLYSEEYNPDNLACSRLCFINDIGGPAFMGEDELAGCNKGCARKIYDRVNRQLLTSVDGEATFDEKGIFLDDLLITFSDNGMTGVGLDKYTTLLLYNIYTIAINDRPCIIFKGRISSGCRRGCAHPGLPLNCDNSGLPFDLDNPFKTMMYEGQKDAILVGGLVSKVVDEYEFSRFECREMLDVTLANRGDDVVDPQWLAECPRLNVRVAAEQGSVAMNSREFIEIFLGAEKTFISPIAFLGYPLDSNSALRMIRYKMSELNPYFNSNQGTERVRLTVSDQGFSGADTSGEFDGSASVSILEFVIDIIPVNNLPIITVPRASDPIEVNENVPTQMSLNALSPGLDVQDVDSDECVADKKGFGKLTLILTVPHGRIWINPVTTQTLEALPGFSQESLDFFLNPTCNELECATRLTAEACDQRNACSWNSKAFTCICKLVRRPGKKCSTLKIRGISRDIRNAIRTAVYTPEPRTNYLNFLENPEILSIRVSDKREPDDPANTDVSCGETLGDLISWTDGEANLRTTPVSQPAIVTVNPPLVNPSFEYPVICEGNLDCEFVSVPDDGMVQCTGVRPMPAMSTFGWSIQGVAGVSYFGWSGDVSASEGQQHVYLNPGVLNDAIVSQTIPGLVIGGRYKIIITLGARTNGNRGSAFRLSMLTSVDYQWADMLPTIEENLVVSLPGKDTYERETEPFFAHRKELPLKLQAFVTNQQVPAPQRLVFVDDVRVQFLAYHLLEGTQLEMKSVRVVDPDYVPGVLSLMKKNGFDFHFKISIEAKYGVFILKTDKCTVAPPNQFMDDAKRVEWGYMCWKFSGDVNPSIWANQTLFRPDCPSGWSGKGTQFEPCVNMPLKFLNATFSTPYFAYYFPAGQAQIPQKYIEMIGSKEGIEEVIQNRLIYVPDPYFNTDNLGKEILTFTSNDMANYNGDPRNPNIVVQKFTVDIKAVNNPPNVTFAIPELEINEDFSTVLAGIQISDPDVNEMMCTAEPCETSEGILVMRASVQNGSISVSDNVISSNFAALRSEVFGPVYSEAEYLQECLMKLACTPMSGYLSLAAMTQLQFCIAYPDRCLKHALFCALGEMATRDRTISDCLDQMNVAGLAGVALAAPALEMAERTLQDRIWNILAGEKRPLIVARSNYVIFAGTLKTINRILDMNALTYTPRQYYNGLEQCIFEVNDVGNNGIGFPCDPESEVPDELMFQYCSKKLPTHPLVVRRSFSIVVMPVNNQPVLEMYDIYGGTLLDGLPAMDALQNVTRILNRMRVIDVDILETPGCEMSVSFSCKAGGNIFFNITKAPKLEYSTNPTGTEILAIGTLSDIQIFVSNIEYRSDAQFSGIENIIVNIKDDGCTGADLVTRYSNFETFMLQVVVSRPKVCRFPTCELCVKTLEEECGWCPSSCKGRGKCKEAVSRGGAPKIGDCPPYCIEGVCLTWNQCDAPPDTSWKIGATGAPILFFATTSLYFLFMWARRHYGTIPLYISKSGANVIRMVRNLSFSPQEHSRVGQIVYLVAVVTIGLLLPGILQEILRARPVIYPLGEAASFKLQTDACTVKFVSDPSFDADDSPKIETMISGNGTLEDVMIYTDFCADDQFIEINNTRLESVRYTGYQCDIRIRIPADPAHSIPPMHITNVGSSLTTISTSSDEQVVNFEPNLLTIEGTFIKINLFNLRVRRLFIPYIEKGDVRIHNLTFTQIQIETGSADIAISISPLDTMLVPIDIRYRQPTNAICFVSADSPAFSLQNTCKDRFREVITTTQEENVVDGELVVTFINTTKVFQDWTCTQDSKAVLVPFKRDLQPGLSNLDVQLTSETGQIFFQSIPPDRVPPRAGRGVLDSLYVHDGIRINRELAIEEQGAKLLDVKFHPGGAKRPKEEWLELKLSGPGIPVGTFLWVSDIRYLVLPRNILSVLSCGLLVPRQAVASVPMKPSFCPEFDAGSNPETQFLRPNTTRVERAIRRRSNTQTHDGQTDASGGWAGMPGIPNIRRGWEKDGIGNSFYLVELYRLLYKGVNGPEMPATSYIAYQPRIGPPVVFEIDPVTGITTPKEVLLSDFPLMVALLAFGLLIPGIFALAVTTIVVLNTRGAIKSFRQRKFNQEVGSRSLLDCLRPENPDDQIADQEILDLKLMFYSKTNFFYFLDYQMGDPDEVASLQTQAIYTVVHLTVVAFSFVPLLVLALNWKQSRLAFECSSEAEPELCGAVWSVPEIVILIAIMGHSGISTAELYCHYANLAWKPWRKALRLTWYTTQSLMTFGSIFYLAIILTWIFIGLFITPSQFLPYVTGFFGGTLVLAKYWGRTARTNERTANAIRARAERLSERGYGELPIEAVVAILDKTLEKFLRRYKLTIPTLVNAMFIIFILIASIQSFLIVGFTALTDTSNIYVGSFNSLVTAIFMMAIDQAINAKKDKELQAQDITVMVKEAISEGVKTIQFLSKQVDMGVLLMEAAKKNLEEKEAALSDGGDLSEDDQIDINQMLRIIRRREKAMYEVDKNLAKQVINEDKFTRDAGQRIAVDVPGEVAVTDMMMPPPAEPSESYAPSMAAGQGFPSMVILLCEMDEDVSPGELQEKLAELYNVNPERFAITIADA